MEIFGKIVSLFVYDFDGVMTDNKVYIDQYGNEIVQVNRADGLGVSKIKQKGIPQIIISTEKNSVVSTRAKKLKIPCLQGINNKKETLNNYCKEKNINLKQVAYVGNDINDKDAMTISGTILCPADAHRSIKDISDHILNTKGGDGVIREIVDLLILETGV